VQAVAWTCWLALVAVVLISAVRWLRRTGEFLAPLPIAAATVFLYVSIRVAYLLIAHQAPTTSDAVARSEQLRLISKCLCLVLGGYVAFLLGHRVRWAARAGADLKFALPAPVASRALPTAMILGACGFGAFLLVIESLGGPAYAFAHQAQMTELLQGKGVLYNISRLMIVPSGLLFLKTGPGWRRVPAAVWASALLSTLCFAVLGRRSVIVMAIGYPVLLYHLCVRPIPARLVVIAGMPAAACLVALSFVRLIGLHSFFAMLHILRRYPSLLANFFFNSSGEFKIFDALTIVVREVPRHMPYSDGMTFLRVPFMVIPRAFWFHKPVTLGETLVATYVPNLKAGWPPMIFGELYATFGPLAVLVGMFLFGALCRGVWEWHRSHAGVGNATVYILFCYFVFDAVRVGDPARTILAFVTAVVFFTFAFGLAAARIPATAGSPSLGGGVAG